MGNNNLANPINDQDIIKIIDVYSHSNNSRSFKKNIMNYTKKDNNKNDSKYKDELLDYLNNDIGFNFNFFNDLNNFINIRDNSKEKDLTIVLNTDYNSTMILAKVFIEECLKNDINLDFDIDFHVKGETDNSFMINCSSKDCENYIRVLDNIMYNYPDLYNDIYEPGLLFSKMKEKYGIFSCKNGIDDFYEKRSRHLFCAIDSTYKDFISKNCFSSFNYEGRDISIIDFITRCVNREIFIDLTFNFLSDKEFFDKYGFNKDKSNNTDFITNSSEVREKLIKRIKDKNTDEKFEIKVNYGDNDTTVIINDELINSAIRKSINEIVKNRDDLRNLIINNIGLMYSVMGIYKDNYAFDTDDNYINNKSQMKKMS